MKEAASAPPRRTLSTQSLLAILVACLLIPVIVFAGVVLARFAEGERSRLQAEALNSARRIAAAVDRELGGLESAMRVLSTSRLWDARDYPQLYGQATEVKGFIGAEVVLKDANGQHLVNTRLPFGSSLPSSLPESDRKALETKQPAISDLFVGATAHRPIISISVPVLRNGEVAGLVSMGVDPERFAQLFQAQGLPPEWTGALVDRSGKIVARSRQHERFVGTTATADLRARATGLEGTWIGTTVEGTPVLSAYARSALAGWRAAVGVPVATVEAPLRQSLYWLLGFGALGLGLSTLVAGWCGRQIAGAMRDLASAAASLGGSDPLSPPRTALREVNDIGDALLRASDDLAERARARNRAEAALGASKARLERILDTSPVGIAEVDATGAITYANAAAERMLRLERSKIEGRRYDASTWAIAAPSGGPISSDELPAARALRGETVANSEITVIDQATGERIVLSVNATPVLQDGYVAGALTAFTDITGRYRAERALREETERQETLNRTGQAIAAELDLERIVQTVTDAGVALTGAAIGAFFYNTLNDKGESYTLYTISGVPREHFSKFPLPRNTHVFEPTFRGQAPVRSNDITKDERYGRNAPYKGMPEGHLPVRSYLAVPVLSRSGEVIGGLFFGHPEVAVFTEKHELLLTGIAAQAAIAIDNAQLYQAAQRELDQRRQAEERLRELNETLESRVAAAIAERESAQEQLRQAQKMEAVGQLTGGIAHDFNNLLTGVIGSLDMMQRRINQGQTDRIERYTTAAMTAANRAAALTHRLLAFSRRQPLDPKPVNANRLVTGMEELLRRTIGETISLEIVTAGGLWLTLCDPHQLESAILNLAINARDAMPEGGKLTIEACNAHLDNAYAAQQREVRPGQYICICVTDTGTGMTPDVLAKAFDPFFTTKPIGQGTGLGLSMIYGFARQSEGYAKIYSEVGQGTTVKLYLPRYYGVAEQDGSEKTGLTEAHQAEPGETVLVVEDEAAVRDLVVDVLKELGYRAVKAADGPSGLRLLQSDMRIDLLVTDVGLPGLNGRQLADAARQHRPDLKVLFMTGYAENATIANGFLEPGMQMITKPFAIEALATRIRDMIEGA